MHDKSNQKAEEEPSAHLGFIDKCIDIKDNDNTDGHQSTQVRLDFWPVKDFRRCFIFWF